MSIQEELRAELKDAMRAKDRARLDVIRQVESEISVVKSASDFSGEVDDKLYLKVVAAYVKRMQKALKEYEAAGERGAEMVETLGFEVSYLSRWLPKMLSEQDTRALVVGAIADLGLADPKQAGRVVGHLMKDHKGKLDGGLASKIARELLEA
jgi:uncharacterized protein